MTRVVIEAKDQLEPSSIIVRVGALGYAGYSVFEDVDLVAALHAHGMYTDLRPRHR